MSLSRAGVVAGLDMTTEAALTKLAYLLALPDSTPAAVARLMSVSLRGELTSSSQPVFSHPDAALPDRARTLTMLGYAIAHGDLPRVQQILQAEHHWPLNDADYSGNTPIVSRPGPSCVPLFVCSPRAAWQKLQHVAASSPSLAVLRFLLTQGGSVHLRNRQNRTPLFLAANAGLLDHVLLLRQSGAHLHADELPAAQLLAQRLPAVWSHAGLDEQAR